MMTVLYGLYAASLIVAYRGKRKLSIILFIIALVASVLIYKWHATSHLTIHL
ncbi:MAG: hypothetical protein KDC42_02535 [Ignavibacteriae bacterium]|nr:hypothetical protein [Ignavibacteriota bacterium]